MTVMQYTSGITSMAGSPRTEASLPNYQTSSLMILQRCIANQSDLNRFVLEQTCLILHLNRRSDSLKLGSSETITIDVPVDDSLLVTCCNHFAVLETHETHTLGYRVYLPP